MVIHHFEVRQGKRNIGKNVLRIVGSGANIFYFKIITKYAKTVEVAKSDNFRSEMFCFLSDALPFVVWDNMNHNWI